jgi:hypothetical protein
VKTFLTALALSALCSVLITAATFALVTFPLALLPLAAAVCWLPFNDFETGRRYRP